MQKILPFVIAMLLAPSNTMKLDQQASKCIEGDAACTQAFSQVEVEAKVTEDEDLAKGHKGKGKPIHLPSGKMVTSTVLSTLHMVGQQLKRHKRSIEHTIDEQERNIAHLAKQMGVKVDRNNLPDPRFMADLISAEYQDFLKHIGRDMKREDWARSIDDFTKRAKHEVQRQGLAQEDEKAVEEADEEVDEEVDEDVDEDVDGELEEDESANELNENETEEERRYRSRGPSRGPRRGPRRYRGRNGPGRYRGRRPRRYHRSRYGRRPSYYCRGVSCQIMRGMPPANEVFNQWIRYMSEMERHLNYNSRWIERDIRSFNEILVHEGKRLHVPPSKKPMPDAKVLTQNIRELLGKLSCTALKNKRDAIRQISQFERGLASMIGSNYQQIARMAGSSGRRLPRGNRELLRMGDNLLKRLQRENNRGRMRHAENDVAKMEKRAHVKGPNGPQMQDYVDGALRVGRLFTKDPHSRREMKHMEHKGKKYERKFERKYEPKRRHYRGKYDGKRNTKYDGKRHSKYESKRHSKKYAEEDEEEYAQENEKAEVQVDENEQEDEKAEEQVNENGQEDASEDEVLQMAQNVLNTVSQFTSQATSQVQEVVQNAEACDNCEK